MDHEKERKMKTKQKVNSQLLEANRGAFLNFVHEVVDYVSTQPEMTPSDVAKVTALSILAALDGEAVQCGPYALRPIDEHGNEGEDIAGSLHERLCI